MVSQFGHTLIDLENVRNYKLRLITVDVAAIHRNALVRRCIIGAIAEGARGGKAATAKHGTGSEYSDNYRPSERRKRKKERKK